MKHTTKLEKTMMAYLSGFADYKGGTDEKTQDELEEYLEQNEQLLNTIIDGAIALGFIDDLLNYMIGKVNKPLNEYSLQQDSFEYFVDLMVSQSSGIEYKMDESEFENLEQEVPDSMLEKFEAVSNNTKETGIVTGNFLKSFYHRLIMMENARELLLKAKVELYENEQIKDFKVILSELAEKWSGLDCETQHTIATGLVGRNHEKRFFSLMDVYRGSKKDHLSYSLLLEQNIELAERLCDELKEVNEAKTEFGKMHFK